MISPMDSCTAKVIVDRAIRRVAVRAATRIAISISLLGTGSAATLAVQHWLV